MYFIERQISAATKYCGDKDCGDKDCWKKSGPLVCTPQTSPL